MADSITGDKWNRYIFRTGRSSYQDALAGAAAFPKSGEVSVGMLGLDTAFGRDGVAAFKEALAKTEIDAPNGKIKLDSNRQAIGTNFVTEVVDDGKGALFSKVVKVIPNVNQTLGYDPAVFAKIGVPSRTVPECKKY